MAESHAEVFYFDKVPLKGVVKSIFKDDKFGYLQRFEGKEDKDVGQRRT
jgi:hypothetical protein